MAISEIIVNNVQILQPNMKIMRGFLNFIFVVSDISKFFFFKQKMLDISLIFWYIKFILSLQSFNKHYLE
jgi:hypothetical protein